MTPGELFSKNFTELALNSNPKNIGLFVNCTPAKFVKKIFYRVEFNTIIKWYQRIKKDVKIYIFNLQNMNCFYIKSTIEVILTWLKSTMLDAGLKQRIKDMIKQNLKTSLRNKNFGNCLDIYEKLEDILSVIADEKPIDVQRKNDLIATFTQFNKILKDENNKNCFDIKKLLEKKLLKKNLKIKKLRK